MGYRHGSGPGVKYHRAPENANLVKPTRVFLLAREPLFAQGVRSLIFGQADMEVVGTAAVGAEGLALMRASAPDVVVIEARGEEQGALVTEVLEVLPQAKVVGLTPEDNRLHIWYSEMRQGRRVEDFLEAIREPPDWRTAGPASLRVYVLFQGPYGIRIVDNLRRHAPAAWMVEAWQIPAPSPDVQDSDRELLPEHVPAADLVVVLGEDPSLAQLVPAIVERTGARAVIVPIDNPAWLPEGVSRLLRARLSEVGVAAAFPKPFCSLTEGCYGVGEHETVCEDPWIAAFAHHFGRPAFRITCDGEDVTGVEVVCDTACGCASSLAERLIGTAVCDLMAQVEEFHRQYPCLATLRVEPGLGASLLQVSCALMQRAVAAGAGVDVELAPRV